MNVDELALKTAQAIGSIDPDKLPGGKTQAIAQAQCLVIDAIKNSGEYMKPISVKDRLPQIREMVLASLVNELGKRRVICAGYVPRFTIEAVTEEDNDEYHDESDTFYLCEGWYENIENWPDFESVHVGEGEVTHWMPVPQELLQL